MTTTWIRIPCASFDGQQPGRADVTLVDTDLAQLMARHHQQASKLWAAL